MYQGSFVQCRPAVPIVVPVNTNNNQRGQDNVGGNGGSRECCSKDCCRNRGTCGRRDCCNKRGGTKNHHSGGGETLQFYAFEPATTGYQSGMAMANGPTTMMSAPTIMSAPMMMSTSPPLIQASPQVQAAPQMAPMAPMAPMVVSQSPAMQQIISWAATPTPPMATLATPIATSISCVPATRFVYQTQQSQPMTMQTMTMAQPTQPAMMATAQYVQSNGTPRNRSDHHHHHHHHHYYGNNGVNNFVAQQAPPQVPPQAVQSQPMAQMAPTSPAGGIIESVPYVVASQQQQPVVMQYQFPQQQAVTQAPMQSMPMQAMPMQPVQNRIESPQSNHNEVGYRAIGRDGGDDSSSVVDCGGSRRHANACANACANGNPNGCVNTNINGCPNGSGCMCGTNSRALKCSGSHVVQCNCGATEIRVVQQQQQQQQQPQIPTSVRSSGSTNWKNPMSPSQEAQENSQGKIRLII